MKRVILPIAVTAFTVWTSLANASLIFDFSWIGGSDSVTALGTMEINAAAGESFVLSDIVATDITVSSDLFTTYSFTGWTSAGGSIAADGLSAAFSVAGNPYFQDPIQDSKFFGCLSPLCGGGHEIRAVFGDTPIDISYESAADAVASMQMTRQTGVVPAPVTLPLLVLGLAILGWSRRKKHS
ncbi:PEP-CTERM sorting domain-containing protein [Congregibacter variabilis]|uniref:PEP-CTERM sorting domain-containing protein n=1 Tax=Congregibacter variabilis TaxID=3081200 RepID=A0ABZ0HZS5_9GAMM|nr:PEP-CTERM sorting domain-containing protein [Congregibacter sp. IMCC43200]